MSQQSLRQASIRVVTGTTGTHEEDWHALWDIMAIAAGPFNQRMLSYINQQLGASYTELNGAMAAFAAFNSATTFQAIGTFSPGFAALLAGAYTNVVAGSFFDNSLIIRDTVTGANAYSGPLITAGAFNKFTYSRASTASFVGSNGLIQTASTNIPRIHYNPSTLAILGYLHEGARTNLALQSEDFATTWVQSAITVSSNAIAAPDGTLTADKLVEDATSGLHRPYQAITVSGAAVYTWSIYLKAAERTWAALNAYDGVANQLTWINLATGALGTNAAGNTSIVRDMGNGWYRLEVSRITAGTDGYLEVYLAPSDNVISYAGDITKGIYAWGAQLELGGAASSYIPTTTVAVTRAADRLSLPNTLFNLTQAAGTLYGNNTYDGGTAPDPQSRASISVTDTIGGSAQIYNRIGVAGATIRVAGVYQAFITDIAVADGVFTKNALAYASNDYALVQDGRAAQTDVGSVPATTMLELGGVDSGTILFGTIKEFAFIGQRVSNGAMQALTS